MITVNFNFINFLIVIIFFILALFLFFKLKNLKLNFLRLLTILFLLFLTLNFTYKKSKDINETKIALLIDNSYSMSFNNRLNKVKNFIEKNYEKLKKYNPSIYLFNENLYPLKHIEDLKIENKRTKINDVLEKNSILRNYDIIFVFSDGINYTSELPNLKKDNMVILPICFKEENFKDLSISNIRTSKIGFKDVEHLITTNITSYGYEDIKCNVQLIDFENKEILCSKDFIVKEGENEIALSFVPKKLGKNKYFIRLKELKDEITYENNKKYFDLEIKKNKIRVLYICGQPSPEYFHLRNLLKNNPSIDLVSFVILRNPESVVIVPDDDLALIPFPTYDIFVKELFNYDLIIFENFTYNKFGIFNYYLENVKKFVLSGGGFIMIGGMNSFFLGGYKFTPIEEILPVELSEKEKFLYLEYQPQVVNYNNKFVKILDDEKENKSLWENIPKLGNYQKVVAKQDASVILKYQDNPIMCYYNKSKGRIFVSLTNTTWRWNFGNLLKKKYDYKNLYAKFWKNIIYWCAGVEDLKDFYIICGDNYNINEEVEVNIITNLDEKTSTTLQGFLVLPDGSKKNVYINKIENKRYKFRFIPNMVGQYKIVILIQKGKDFIKEEKNISVNYLNFEEIVRLKPDIEYMSKLAQISGQKIRFLEEVKIESLIEEINKDLKKSFVYINEIYRNPVVGFIFIFFYILEIYLARMKK
ncbi:MAG: glutamine amidotransferase [Endomicrobiia bacterium]